MKYRIFRILPNRNRAYVIDLRGNKLYYGTIHECQRFIDYMEDATEGAGAAAGSALPAGPDHGNLSIDFMGGVHHD